MGDKNKIDFSSKTFNPLVGCSRGCPYCYAENIFRTSTGLKAGHAFTTPTFYPERLKQIEALRKPAEGKDNSIFLCSMSDLLGHDVNSEWIERILGTAAKKREWAFLLITKNPGRYAEFKDLLCSAENIWTGATATDQASYNDAESVFSLDWMQSKGRRFLCFEPLLGSVKTSALPCEWVIIGGQNRVKGKVGAKQPERSWVDSLVKLADSAKASVFIKQGMDHPCQRKERPVFIKKQQQTSFNF